MARRQRRSLLIEGLAVGGEGVARVDLDGESRAVFVPGAFPGERVEAEIDASTRPARASGLRLLEASPLRREPPCAHAARCGGCPWMFVSDEGQRQARQRLLDDTVLRALGPSAPAGVAHHEAPERLGYRSRARLAFVAGKAVHLGYRGARERRVVEVERCLVLVPALDGALALVRSALSGAQGEGEVRLSLGREGLPVVELLWERGEPPGSLFAALDAAVTRGALAGAAVRLAGAAAPAVVGDPTIWTPGPDGQPLETPDFAQANPAVSRSIAELLVSLFAPGCSVVELFAGAGTFTVALAPGSASYTAVEGSRPSCEALRRNLARRGLGAVRVVEADADGFALPRGTERVVLDPPRAGARGVAAALVRSKVNEVAYVSCDPVTMARDLGALVGAFEVRALHTFDMFPQTSQIELLAQLVRRR